MGRRGHVRFGAAVVVLGVLLGGLIGSGHVRSYDVWWHLQLGQDILRTREIGLHDDYSHSARGNFRPPQQWLFEVLEAAVHGGGGERGLVWLRMVLAAASLGLLAALLVRRRSSYLIAVVMLVLVASASMPNVTCRPHLVMPLLLLALVSILTGSKRRPWLQWLTPLVFVVWANVHASFMLGLGVVGAWMVYRACGSGDKIGDGLKWSGRGLAESAGVLVASVAGCMVNPVGVKLLAYSLKYLPGGEYAYAAQAVQEWQAPAIGSLDMAATTLVLVGGALVVLVRWRQVSVFEVLVMGLMLVMGLRWERAAMPAAIVMAWVVAPVLSEWVRGVSPGLMGWRRGSEDEPERVLPVALVVVMLVGVLAISRPVVAKRALNEGLFPVAAADWIESHDLAGNMYNPYQWGGYLIHRLYPRHRVFIDGRVDMYGEEVFRDWLALREATDDWEQIASRYGVKWGLAEADGALTEAVRSSANWQVMYEDRQAVVFARGEVGE